MLQRPLYWISVHVIQNVQQTPGVALADVTVIRVAVTSILCTVTIESGVFQVMSCYKSVFYHYFKDPLKIYNCILIVLLFVFE